MNFNRRAVLFAVILLAMGIALTSACGGDKDDQSTATQGAASTKSASTQQAATTDGNEDGDAEEGRKLAAAQCMSCHTPDGRESVGPTWKGLYGSEIELESGETLTVDDEYISESIVDPNAKVHTGFPQVMPSFGGLLTEEQIQDIITYIRTLS